VRYFSPIVSQTFGITRVTRRVGGDEGDRTPDLNAASVALSQLSYVPGRRRKSFGVPKGIRTPVAGVKGRCPRPTRRWGRENR
tara:strand:- start:1330 stop:1578 length:249 start_codon:yes stop_codon:yes gene_type:complete